MPSWKAALAGLFLLAFVPLVLGDDAPPAPVQPSPPVVILSTRSAWRLFEFLKPPIVALPAGMKPITSQYEWVDSTTPAVPEGWTKENFADGSWLRTTANGGSKTPYAASLSLRGKFMVTDPAQVKDLKLSVDYQGGVIVSLNGVELTRRNLPAGKITADTLADAYPTSVFVNDQGAIVIDAWNYTGPKEAITGRVRHVAGFPILASALRKGVNLLAIQAIRAPYDKAVADYWARQPKDTRELGEKGLPYDLNWNTCQINNVELASPTSAGLVSNAVRPKEMQAWNSDILVTDLPTDMGDNCEPLQPAAIKGARNGWASAKIVLGSPKPIEGLKVVCGDLRQGANVIPASALRARYAIPYDDRRRNDSAIDTLLEKPLPSFTTGNDGGAVVPVWFTLQIPKDARPGHYTGEATVSAAGEKTLTVPLTLDVADFVVPDTQDYRTWVELMQSPDTLAAEYKVPLWSDRHWQMIADSFRYIGQTGSRVVQIPLIAHTNSGAAESMVRWIKKADGSYGYDYSIMDKYLDVAVKNMGKPKFVAFIAWDIYLNTPKAEVTDRDPRSEKSWQAARWDLRGKGPAVTALDPATGQTATVNLPRFEDPAALAAWKPLFDELHKKMRARGLEDTMLLGMASDAWPNAAEMKTLDTASGHLEWINQTHQGPLGAKLDGIAKVAYTAYVWPNKYPTDPDKGRTYGWKRPDLVTEFRRFTALNDWQLPAVMIFPELEITGQQRGLGRIGADFWPALKDKRGQRRQWVWAKYPASEWHSCNLMSHMLNPGPDGPVATPRYEMLREGLQECEARIAIETALTTPSLKAKLSPELADRAQKLLDARVEDDLKSFSGLQLSGRVYTTYADYGHIFYYNAGGDAGSYWFASSDWQDRAQRLYALAGEVNHTLSEK